MNTALFDINNILTRVHVSSVNKQSLFSLQFMRTNLPDVFSAGDVTSFPLTIRGDEMVNIGHWQMSQAQGMILENSQSYFYFSEMPCLYLNKHSVNMFFFISGRVAALNMLKKPTTFESVPFFWTVLLGKSIRYTGRMFFKKKIIVSQ